MIQTAARPIHPSTQRWAQFLARIAGADRYLPNWAIRHRQDAARAGREDYDEKLSVDFFRLEPEFTEAFGLGFQP